MIKHCHEHSPGEKPVRVRAVKKTAPGDIHVERHMHDEAVVISGSLTVVTDDADFDGAIASKLEAAARTVKERGGIVGHIKASVSVTSVKVISITDEDAHITPSPERTIKLVLAAIVFLIDPAEAEAIIRTALTGLSQSAGKSA